MSVTNSVSPIGSEGAAPVSNIAQSNEEWPPGPTFLIDAMRDGDVTRIKRMLDELSKFPVKDRNAYVTEMGGANTRLHYAARHFTLIQFLPQLIEHAPKDFKFFAAEGSDNRKTVLHLLASNRASMDKKTQFDCIRQLVQSILDKDMDSFVTKQDERGWTALHYAAEFGTPEILDYLIDKAGDSEDYLKAKTSDGNNALHCAVLAATADHDLDRVEKLLARSNNIHDYININGVYHKTHLHIAAFFDAPDLAAILLKNGADLKVQNGNGETAWDTVCTPFENGKCWKFIATLLLFDNDNMDPEFIHKTSPQWRGQSLTPEGKMVKSAEAKKQSIFINNKAQMTDRVTSFSNMRTRFRRLDGGVPWEPIEATSMARVHVSGRSRRT
ncbi:ankyrin repeat-containing domain protein [Astrocystis sublimbata]|nr:ankyrin repeat-containing domain protein [Astrocystis sublimbata]